MAEPRMRTIRKTVEFLKERDPNTSITYGTIEKIVKSGDIPSIKVGNRNLILVNDVYKYFYGVPLSE